MKTGAFTKIGRKLIELLLNERGEIGDVDEEVNNDVDVEEEVDSGEVAVDETDGDALSEEELALTEGESPPGLESLVDKEEEESEEAAAAKKQEGAEVEAARVAAEEKLDLFKSDPEAYYEKYPDEKPAEPVKEEPVETGKTDGMDPGAMVVNGGKYDGMTLNQVYAQDPAAAQQLHYNYLKGQESEAAAEVAEQAKRKEEAVAEVREFATSLKRELFGDIDELSEAQAAEINKVTDETISFIEKTKRARSLTDARYLMNRESDLAKAAGGGAAQVAAALDKGASERNVSTAKGGGGETGFEAYEAMSSDKLESVIDNMNDEQVVSFYKNAPLSLRNKHPNIPWD